MSPATSAIPAPQVGARRPALDRGVAMQLAVTEYERFVEHLRILAPTQWQAPTCCPPWDVRHLVCHVLGMAEFAASTPERVRQMRAAKRRGGLFIDALTALQVAKHEQRTPDELVTAMAVTGPRAARGRRRTPAPLRRLAKITSHADAAGEQSESWTLGYLTDVIMTRDTWMHRCDIAAATGTDPELTAGHDGVLVADIVAEWAGRHGQPCRLTLTGPAGGRWAYGSGGGDEITLDAIEFCRILAGRGDGTGLLATRLPF